MMYFAMALCTLALAGAAFDSIDIGERALFERLLERLTPGMLLADRGFPSYDLYTAAARTGAELLWRLGDTIALPLVAKLGDGSYTSLVFASRTPARVREQVLAAAAPGRTCSRGPVAPGWSGWSSTTCRTGAPTGSASCSAC